MMIIYLSFAMIKCVDAKYSTLFDFRLLQIVSSWVCLALLDIVMVTMPSVASATMKRYSIEPNFTLPIARNLKRLRG